MSELRNGSYLLSVVAIIYSFSAHGMEQNRRDINGDFIYNAGIGNINEARKCLSDGADVNAQKAKNGMSALHWAAVNGKEDAVDFLLDQENIVVDIENNEGKSPLQFAAGKRHGRIVRKLLNAKADVNKADKRGQTALHRAAWEKENSDVVLMLLKEGADLSLADRKGATPLHWSQDSQSTKWLIQYGASVNTRDVRGRTPLHRVGNDSESVKLLVEQVDIKVDLRDEKGMTPLCRAIIEGNVASIKALVAGGADVNEADSSGKTALHWLLSMHKGAPTHHEYLSKEYGKRREKCFSTDQVIDIITVLDSNYLLDSAKADKYNVTPVGYAKTIRYYSPQEKQKLASLLELLK